MTIKASDRVQGNSASPPSRRQASTIPPSPTSRMSPYTVPGTQTYSWYTRMIVSNGAVIWVSGLACA
jgi:hypothetical protein